MSYCRCRDQTTSRYQEAIDLQDACNLRAIARSLVRAADEAANEGGTAASYSDAAVILIVDKINNLVNGSIAGAWDECHRKAQGR